MGCSDIGPWIGGGLAGSASLVDVVLGSDVRVFGAHTWSLTLITKL